MAGFSFATTRSSSWQVLRGRLERANRTVEGREWLAVKRAALLAEREIKQGIQRGAPGGQRFAPLAPTTRLLRRGTKPLLDAGGTGLWGSISTTLSKKDKSAFVGVHRTAKGDDGRSLMNVALAHEFGTKPYVIKVTPGIRRLFWFLHYKSKGAIKPLSPSTTQIMHPGVPARPFIRPTIQAIHPQLQQEIQAAFTQGGGPV